MTNVEAVLADPSWLPHRIVGRDSIQFIHAGRDLLHEVTFLDDPSLGADAPRLTVRLQAMAAMRIDSAPTHFIFHSAFARSTLLARALDLPGKTVALREPIILNDATALARAGQLSSPMLAAIAALLGRNFVTGERVIIKPSNSANYLMARLLEIKAGARAIILYRDLREFLRSIARKGMFGRIWARRHLFQIRNDAPFTTGFSESDLFAQSDLQAAAFGWLIQLGQFAQLAKSYPERVRVLNSDTLVHDAASALEKSTAWFGLGLDAELIEQVISGDAFSRDSKEPGRRFDQPKGDEAPVDQAEIDMVVEWTHAVASHVELPLNFGPRLMDA